MKIVVIMNALKKYHKDMIDEAAKKAGAEVFYFDKESDVPKEHMDADIVYGQGINMAKTCENLKWLCASFAGVDNLVKPDSFKNPECILTNSAGAYGVSIAEHIIALSLMMMRRITEFYAETLNGQWLLPRAQRSLKDSRITVLGTGDIGTTFVHRVKGFEPKSIIGVSRSGVKKDPLYDEVYKVEDLDKVLPNTDLLVMSLPSTPETIGILSRERIALLPETAYVVNVGRGTAIDEEALADALNHGMIAGAALDVFSTEPLPKDNRLWHTKNLLITPHVAGNLTLEHTVTRNVEMFVEDLDNYVNKRPMAHLVNKKIGY